MHTVRLLGVLAVISTVTTLGGEAWAQQCVPACREGFQCLAGSCEPLCNPPCPAGEACLEGRYCEPMEATCNPPCPAGDTCVDGRYCEPATSDECYPPCREGYMCSDGTCVGPPASPTGPVTPTGPTTPATPTGPATPAPPTGGTPAAQTTGGEPVAEGTGADAPRPTLLRLRLGFGGTVDGTPSARAAADNAAALQDDLVATLGASVEHDWMLRVDRVGLSMGLMLSGLFWNTSTSADVGGTRSALLELDVVPKVSYRIQPGLFAYLAIPVGLSVSLLSNDAFQTVDTSAGFGWNLSVLLGAQYATDMFGVFAELGADVHNFGNTVDGLGSNSFDYDFNFAQFALNLGIAF